MEEFLCATVPAGEELSAEDRATAELHRDLGMTPTVVRALKQAIRIVYDYYIIILL